MIPPMWKRFRRRSMAPRRPAVFPEQWGLAMVSVGAVVLAVAAVVAAVLYAVS
jgi:hypothetical protein